MAEPIYKLFMMKPTEAWYQLSEEEQNSLIARVDESREQVGGKSIVMCTSRWCTEQWMFFGVEEFPNVEAAQQHAAQLVAMQQPRYVESVSMLGTQWPPE